MRGKLALLATSLPPDSLLRKSKSWASELDLTFIALADLVIPFELDGKALGAPKR